MDDAAAATARTGVAVVVVAADPLNFSAISVVMRGARQEAFACI